MLWSLCYVVRCGPYKLGCSDVYAQLHGSVLQGPWASFNRGSVHKGNLCSEENPRERGALLVL